MPGTACEAAGNELQLTSLRATSRDEYPNIYISIVSENAGYLKQYET